MELQHPQTTVKTAADRFTGDVYMTPIYSGTHPSRMTAALVRFTPGARTNWHSHDVGQTLHVIEGVGLVGTRDGSVVRARAGDTVVCLPGEEHWHGAALDTFMSHFALLEANIDGSDPTTWLEPSPTSSTTPPSSTDNPAPRKAVLMSDQISQPRQVGGGRTTGVTETELVEDITHLAFYTGWPEAMTAVTVAK